MGKKRKMRGANGKPDASGTRGTAGSGAEPGTGPDTAVRSTITGSAPASHGQATSGNLSVVRSGADGGGISAAPRTTVGGGPAEGWESATKLKRRPGFAEPQAFTQLIRDTYGEAVGDR